MTKKIELPQIDSELEVYRFSLEEYYKMAEVGILHEDSRVELIYGKIIAMSPVGAAHVVCVDLLNEHLVLRGKENGFRVSIQSPIRVNQFSEPEPDIALYKRKENYRATTEKASTKDALLIIEVSDSTLQADQNVKKILYVTSGVPEYLIVNLQNRRLELYTEPTSDGKDYGLVRYYEEDTIFEHPFFGKVEVSDLLPAKLDRQDPQS